MQRIINDPDPGRRGHASRLSAGARRPRRRPRTTPGSCAPARAPIAGKVGVVTGGGSGHEPAFLGYVGENMVDAVAVGEIFSSPTAQAFHDAFKAADGGKGVACLYGNYAGDNMNVKMAIKLAAEGRASTVKTVVANDDVPSAPKTEREKRRGVAGEILMWKVGGAKAADGRQPRRGHRRRAEGHRQLPAASASACRPAPSRRSASPTSPIEAGDDGGRHRPPRRAGHRR